MIGGATRSVRRARTVGIGIVVALLGALWAVPPADAGARAWTGEDVVPGELLVTTAPGRSPEWLQRQRAVFGSVRRLSDRVARVRVVAGQEAAVATVLRRLDGVLAVEPNHRLAYATAPNDDLYRHQWTHRLTKVERAWNTTIGSADVTVALLDSGVDGRHSELSRIVARADTSTGTVRPGAVDNDPCKLGHGTMTAGVVGAAGDNTVGVAGVNWTVSLVDVSLSSPGSGCVGPTQAAAVAALDYVTNRSGRDVDVVNMSFGGRLDTCPTAYQTALDATRSVGITLVAASGNEEDIPGFSGGTQVPASCTGVIAVSSVGSEGGIASYSTTNQWVDLAAPGGDHSDIRDPSNPKDVDGALVLTTARDNRFKPTEGTSFASAYVAGLAALLLAARPSLSPDEIEAALEHSAQDRGPDGRDLAYG